MNQILDIACSVHVCDCVCVLLVHVSPHPVLCICTYYFVVWELVSLSCSHYTVTWGNCNYIDQKKRCPFYKKDSVMYHH